MLPPLNPWHSDTDSFVSTIRDSDAGSPAVGNLLPTSRTSRPKPGSEFEQDVARLLARLRDVYAELLRTLPGPIESGADLQRATKLDMKICWKVHRVVSAPDALSAAPYVLGPANTGSFLRALEAQGAPELTVRRAEECSDELRTLIREHAGDRKTFESMVSNWSSSPQQRVNQRERKAAFKASSHIFGVAVDTMVICTAIRPAAEDPRCLDELTLGGEFGLRRLRRTSFPLFAKWVYPFNKPLYMPDEHDKPPAATIPFVQQRRRPIGQSSTQHHGLGLLADFSSISATELISTVRSDGRYMAQLAHDRVGSKAAVDVALGLMLENMPWRYRMDSDTSNVSGTVINKPCQAVVIDLLVERGTYDQLSVDGCMTAAQIGQRFRPQDVEMGGRLEDERQVICAGRGADVLGLSEVPRYRPMIEWTFEQVNWNLDNFDVYRYRVEYPIALSTVMVSYTLPEEPPGIRLT